MSGLEMPFLAGPAGSAGQFKGVAPNFRKSPGKGSWRTDLSLAPHPINATNSATIVEEFVAAFW